MTHRYTLLVGGTVLPGPGLPIASAIAWAEGIVLAVGTDAQVREVSRGDSHVVDLQGAFVVPVGVDATAPWPPSATLEVGGQADLDVLLDDPRIERSGPQRAVGLVRGGQVVSGSLASREHSYIECGRY